MSPHPGLCITAGAEHSHAEELSRQNRRDLESGILWQLGLTPGSHAPSEISPKRVRGPGHTSKGVLQLQLGLHRLGHPPAHPCQGSHSGGAASRLQKHSTTVTTNMVLHTQMPASPPPHTSSHVPRCPLWCKSNSPTCQVPETP